jgi:hypothetical protein
MARSIMARGLRRKAGQMNKTESAFSDHLRMQEIEGTVLCHRFEGVTLKIANDCRYTPDFMVMGVGGEITFYEVKGFWRDDARVKIKVAARTFPEFRFIGVQKKGQHWIMEDFEP